MSANLSLESLHVFPEILLVNLRRFDEVVFEGDCDTVDNLEG